MSSDTQAAPPPAERPRRIIKRYSNRKLYDTKDSRYVTLAQIAELVRSGEDVQVIDNATKEDKTEATLALIISEEVKSTPKAVPLSTLRDLVHQRSEKILSTLREGPIGRLIGGSEPPGAEGAVAGTEEVAATAETAAPAAPAPVAPTPPPPAAAAAAATPAVNVPPSPATKTRLEELVESSKKTIDQWQAAIDERIRASLPTFLPAIVRDMEGEMRKLALRVEELERVKHLTQRVEELEARVKAMGDDKSSSGKHHKEEGHKG